MFNVYVKVTHRYTFRPNEWAQIQGVTLVTFNGVERPCYRVQFADGVLDTIAIYDPDPERILEFSGEVPEWSTR